MLWIRTEARRGLRWGVFSVASVALLALSNNPAAAAPYSDIVIDANSGAVLHQSNPDAQRHPASLTKIMTLYLLFEQLEAGKLRLDSQLKVSPTAAEQSPTKLGLKAGSTIAVEDAIKGIVTRSANDAAVVVAEAIAGEEDDFAVLMTKKARALGMSRTVYKNASGLPNDAQVTTARDQSILGRAIQERFPKYYKYFQTRSFTFRGQHIGNHNNLLGRVDGVDGIKTGYIRASGFNLVTSVHRGNRYLVAVVMGGSSAGSRDAKMRTLIGETIKTASAKRTAPMLAEVADKSVTKVAAKNEPKPEPKSQPKHETAVVAKIEPKVQTKPETKAAAKPDGKDQQRFAVASSASTPVRLDAAAQAQRIAAGSSEPIRPVLVKTISVKSGTLAPIASPQITLPAPPPAGVAEPASATTTQPVTTGAAVKAKTAKTETPQPEAAKPDTVRIAAAEADTAKTDVPKIADAPATPSPSPTRVAATVPVPAQSAKLAAAAAPARPVARNGWMIQVGAFQAEQEAQQRLSAVQSKASKAVDGTDPFTESVEKGGSRFYRARFAGFDKDKAEAACKVLKRDGVECVTIKN